MTQALNNIKPSQPRDEVRVTFPDGQVVTGPINTPIEPFLYEAQKLGILSFDSQLIAAICNGKLRELTHILTHDSTIKPICLSSSDGGRIYRRSLILLMVTALKELRDDVEINVNYAIPDGGFYCEVVNREPFTPAEIVELEDRMRQIVAEDSPITRQSVPLDTARQMFRDRGDDDRVRLLDYRHSETLTLYTLRDRSDYYYGYMVPSTRYLHLFRLLHRPDGFILQYPRKHSPTQLREISTYGKLIEVFHETDEWLEKLQVEDIGRLNQLISTDNLQELILVAEALHEQNIAQIAGEIDRAYEAGARVVLIAGPSSSGKTTFSRRLAIQLLAHGLHPFTLEMDNYFVDREYTPRDENGDYDFESLYALNLDLLNEHLNRLMQGEEVQIPSFNFFTGRSEPGHAARITPERLIIMEGIHGLNPDLVPDIPPDRIFRVYVSALTGLNIDRHNRVPTTDVRLLRRIVRDARERGYSATDTLKRWASVRRGEKRNIFPYQENADAIFNSALPYELAALRPLAEPLLLQIRDRTPPEIEARRLLAFLRWVQPMDSQQVARIPNTSLLREFIGGSILDDYHPGELFDDPRIKN